MSARLGRVARRQPDRVLAGLAVLAGLCGFVVATGEDRLGLGGGTDSPVLVVRVSGAEPLSSPPSRVALEVMRSQLESDPAVVAVVRGPTPAGDRRTSLRVSFAGEERLDAAVERIRKRLDPGILRVTFAGGAGKLEEVREETIRDLRLLLLAVPLVALLAAAVLGSRLALAALFATAAAVLAAGAACVGLTLLTDVSALAALGAACAGVPVAVLLCGIGPGRAAAGAGLGAAAVFAAAALLGIEHLAWFAAGGALAALLAIPAAAAAVPAAEELWSLSARPPGIAARAWAWLDGRLARRRVLAALLAGLCLAALAALALPLDRLETAAVAGAPPALDEWECGRAAGAALLAVAAIALLTSRRPLAAAGAALGAGISAAAGVAVAVLAFEDGGLDGVLDIRTSDLSLSALVAGAATVGAISASRSIARIAERADGSAPGRPAATGDAAALAGLTAVAAALALTLSSLAFAQQFGVIVAAGVLIDGIVVSGLLRGALGALVPGGRSRRATAGG